MSEDLVENDATDSIRTTVREMVRELAPRQVEGVSPGDRLADDLEFDSLTLMELAVSLEGRFELRAFDETVVDVEIETVADVESIVLELVGRSPS